MTEMPRPLRENRAKLSLAEVEAFLAAEFPQIHHGGKTYEIESVGYGETVMRLLVDDRHLRPGGTVSGPAMMALADVAFYVALLGAIGPVKLAVTTNLSINFLRRPVLRDVACTVRFLKIGRTLAVGEATLTQAGEAEAIAHVVATYSIPPEAKR